MKIGLGLGTFQIRLNQAQEMQLTYLLEHNPEHPEYPNPAKGFDGMKKAHRVLQDYNAVGVLIGGLAENVLNMYATKEELNAHKDVDVMVLDDTEFPELFYQGIDWWLPNEGIWTNGFNRALSFSVKSTKKLKPGLYITDQESVVRMREIEARDNNREIEEVVFQKYIQKVRERVGSSRPPNFVLDEFSGYVLSDIFLHVRDYANAISFGPIL